MSLDNIFNHLKKTFTIRKRVDFDEADIHIELETPSALEEIKITEACKDLEGTSYIEGLKKHSLAYAIKRIQTPDADVELENDMEFEVVDDEGHPEKVTKYLYILEKVESWPSALRDRLFDAFSDLQSEVEEKVMKNTKFEPFKASTVSEESEEEESKFKRIEKPDEDEEGLTETEKMSKKARDEVENIDSHRSQKELDAVTKYRG
jgi:hypothetical protein